MTISKKPSYLIISILYLFKIRTAYDELLNRIDHSFPNRPSVFRFTGMRELYLGYGVVNAERMDR